MDAAPDQWEATTERRSGEGIHTPMSEPTQGAKELADHLLDTWMHECGFHTGNAEVCTCREEQGAMIARMVDAFASAAVSAALEEAAAKILVYEHECYFRPDVFPRICEVCDALITQAGCHLQGQVEVSDAFDGYAIAVHKAAALVREGKPR